MFSFCKQSDFRSAGLKRKRAPSTARESVASTQSAATLARPSATVSKLSADTCTAELGPAAKRSRRTTLTGATQQKTGDDSKPASALPSVMEKGKQTAEEDATTQRNCEMISVIFVIYLCSVIWHCWLCNRNGV